MKTTTINKNKIINLERYKMKLCIPEFNQLIVYHPYTDASTNIKNQILESIPQHSPAYIWVVCRDFISKLESRKSIAKF